MEVGDRFQDLPASTARPKVAQHGDHLGGVRAAELIELHKLLPDEEYFEGTEESYVDLCLSYVNPRAAATMPMQQVLVAELDGESTDTGILMTSRVKLASTTTTPQFPMEPREVEATISIFDEARFRVEQANTPTMRLVTHTGHRGAHGVSSARLAATLTGPWKDATRLSFRPRWRTTPFFGAWGAPCPTSRQCASVRVLGTHDTRAPLSGARRWQRNSGRGFRAEGQRDAS